jgi:hypothetical protein
MTDTEIKNLILQRQYDQTQKLEKKVELLQSDLEKETKRFQELIKELEDPNNSNY